MTALVCIFLLSNYILSLPYFTDDASTWAYTFMTGLILTGLGSILLHVLPAVITYVLVRGIKNMRRKE
jgi:small-conductance mechanosensitive channel